MHDINLDDQTRDALHLPHHVTRPSPYQDCTIPLLSYPIETYARICNMRYAQFRMAVKVAIAYECQGKRMCGAHAAA